MTQTDPTAPVLSQVSSRYREADAAWQPDPELVAQCRRLAAAGAVLLRNERGTLPLDAGESVALFGRVQKDWIAVGYGSGGDVNTPYVSTLLDALRDSGAVSVDAELAAAYDAWCAAHPAEPGEVWGQWPRSYPEMPLSDAVVAAAAQRARTAVVVIGRAAGEDRENTLEPGSYFLTEDERHLLEQVTAVFERTVVVVDTGSVMDLSWAQELGVDALLLAWLGGMEGARAIADVLTGAAEPGGRLTDTLARTYLDHPSAAHFGDPESNDYVEDVFVGYRYFETFAPQSVEYPFGFGLGYTTFTQQVESVEATRTAAPGGPDFAEVTVRVRVTNTGSRAGSDVVQVYVQAPDGVLSTPARSLVAFARTPQIEPGESVALELSVPTGSLCSYDDSGATGHRSAWVLEPGTYRFFVGPDVRRAAEAGDLEVPELIVVEQLEEAAAPRAPFSRMTLARGESGQPEVDYEPVPLATVDLRERILRRLPASVPGSIEDPDATPTDPAHASSPADVVRGAADLNDVIASLTPDQLASLTYGDVTMDSPLGAPGNAGALGGVTESLRARGVPAAITTDGPSGIRVAAPASLLPCGTALASTWDPTAVQELARLHAAEMREKGSDILLSPGMNIHRDPLCGRNFEYFSEDPLVTGVMGAAVVRGIQSQGLSACPKHFACNNQETARTRADSRVSERALREIYLRGFEICVRSARPRTLMTSYNRINGVWAHYHYDLVTTILRDQWGYEGAVMTDWWMQMAADPDFPALADSAYRVRAGVDVLMPGGRAHFATEREDAVMDSYRAPDGITLGEIQRSARHVLRFLLGAGLVED